MAQEDRAITIQQKGFGNAVNAERPAAGPVAVNRDGDERIAILLQECLCVCGLVLVGDAKNRDMLFKQGQCRCLGTAWRTPAAKTLTSKGRAGKLRWPDISLRVFQIRQRNLRDRLSNMVDGSCEISRSPRNVASNATEANPASTRNAANGNRKESLNPLPGRLSFIPHLPWPWPSYLSRHIRLVTSGLADRHRWRMSVPQQAPDAAGRGQ